MARKRLAVNCLRVFARMKTFCILILVWVLPSSGNDSELYSVRFAGPLPDNLKESALMKLKSADQEEFACQIPDPEAASKTATTKVATGPSPMELLKPLFDKRACISRVDPFWTYELCHGGVLRQFHLQDAESHRRNPLNFMLGEYPAPHFSNPFEMTKYKVTGDPPQYKFSRASLPYYPVKLEDGALCAESGMGRRTQVFYICQQEVNGAELYEVNEVGTCEYEALVLTNLICGHPAYRGESPVSSAINCYSLGDHVQPKRADNYYGSVKSQAEEQLAKLAAAAGLKIEFVSTGYARVSAEVVPGTLEVIGTVSSAGAAVTVTAEAAPDTEEAVAAAAAKRTARAFNHATKPQPQPAKISPDQALTMDFLRGSYCIRSAGSAWWRYEYCFLSHATQYHQERGSPRIDVVLGKWHEDSHKEWARSRKAKVKRNTPNGGVTLSHHLRDGDLCDLTGEPRRVEVKLICPPGSRKSQAVAISMTEPASCQYVLSVQSSMVCPYVNLADGDGIADLEAVLEAVRTG